MTVGDTLVQVRSLLSNKFRSGGWLSPYLLFYWCLPPDRSKWPFRLVLLSGPPMVYGDQAGLSWEL
ncbi:hypothetical protein RRF57_006486 [Xylaria bambusicola]|uniref:Uncharacterized protein n=1 Tax=Xylaria bambusicola TaxID=326684 RepID=A0AAN7Z9W5_9PEZI